MIVWFWVAKLQNIGNKIKCLYTKKWQHYWGLPMCTLCEYNSFTSVFWALRFWDKDL